MLRDADVLIVRHEDQAGRQHARLVAKSLQGVAKSVTVYRPADGCNDVSDHLNGGNELDDLVEVTVPGLVEGEGESEGGGGEISDLPPKPSTKSTRTSASSALVDLVTELCETFQWEDQVYASWLVDGHRETWPVNSRDFKGWLSGEYWVRNRVVLGATTIGDALRVIEALARSSGTKTKVHTRVALGQNGAVYVDMLDDAWRAIKITPEGWTIKGNPAVRFIRRPGMLPLPVPERGGSLGDLRQFLNATDEGFILMAAWLVGAYCPWGPYAILDLQGEQGSAKSTTAEILRQLIDPHVASLRVLPDDLRVLAISTRNSWLLAYDNVSYLKPEVSDALCRLSTGAAFVTRALYTDEGEVIFGACHPILMNGIEELGTRPDLLDRTLLVSLPTINPRDRKESRLMHEEFEQMRPRLLGAVLDTVALALAGYRDAQTASTQRMADFAAWAAAASPAFGGPGALAQALEANAERMAALTLESSPVLSAILKLLADEDVDGRWEGNSTELLEALDHILLYQSNGSRSPLNWPKSPRGMTAAINRLSPALRGEGVRIERLPRRRWAFQLLPDSL